MFFHALSRHNRMKQSLMTICFFSSLMFTLFSAGCGDSPTEQPKQSDADWKEVVFFRDVDIRYLVEHNSVLYVSARIPATTQRAAINALFSTKDCRQWDTLKTFDRFIGPIAFHGDTLTILEDGRTWKYHPSTGWEMFWGHLMTANYARDMFWLYDELFVFENVFTMVYSNGMGKELRGIPNEPVVSRFVKHTRDNIELVYTRPYYVFKDNIFFFNGSRFEVLNGVHPNGENARPNYPSFVFHNDTLFAGFNTPSRIKKYTQAGWINASDSILNTPYALEFSSPLINRPTSIVFKDQRMFVGTEWTGVLEKTDTGWKYLTGGLPLAFPDYPEYKMYRAVVQMVLFNNKLIAAYGEPFSAPVIDGRGMYVYDF
jgi:hypothetical protein